MFQKYSHDISELLKWHLGNFVYCMLRYASPPSRLTPLFQIRFYVYPCKYGQIFDVPVSHYIIIVPNHLDETFVALCTRYNLPVVHYRCLFHFLNPHLPGTVLSWVTSSSFMIYPQKPLELVCLLRVRVSMLRKFFDLILRYQISHVNLLFCTC